MKQFLYNAIAKWLELEARILLFFRRPIIVAVTGSVGKTSTKLAIAKVLGVKYNVLAHADSYNTPIGLPLSLYNLHSPRNIYNPLGWVIIFFKIKWRLLFKYPYQVVVQEMGADKPGDIKRFTRYVHPKIGVITAVQPVHTELLGSAEGVFLEKSELAYGSDLVVLNADDHKLYKDLRPKLPQIITTYGVDNAKADIYIGSVKRKPKGTLSATITINKIKHAINTELIGRHSLYSVGAAAAVGNLMGISDKQIVAQIGKVRPAKGRLQLLSGKKQSLIIDDSYNASPKATVAALNTLAEIKAKRRIAVLGSMNELGELEKSGHKEVGQTVGSLNTKIDFLYTIGDSADKYLRKEAIKSGFDEAGTMAFTSPYDAGQYIKQSLQKGDIILVKGSQNRVFSEEAIVPLLAKPSDKNKLVRQSPEWQRIKKSCFKV